MNYQVSIASYRRENTLRDKTLALLAQGNVPAGAITVFVASEEERARYQKALLPGTYGAIVVGVVGMRAIRNFTQAHYPEGTPVWNMDDDVKGFSEKVTDKKLQPLADLDSFIRQGFDMARRARVRLWGVYPVHNALFMQHSVTTDLRFIVGCSWGVFNGQAASLAVTVDEKEDFERTLKYYLADGRVLRFNSVAPQTAFYTEPGGMQVERNDDRINATVDRLLARYPDLLHRKNCKSKHAEVRLRDTRKRKP